MKRNKWFMFFILYISACAVSLNQFKVPPIMGVLAEQFGVGIPQIALLMTAFSVVGIILALPSGVLVSKLGVKTLGVGVLCCLAAGSVLGALSGSNFTLLLIGRVIEGFANAFMLMLGILLINLWFEPKKVGMPTGLFTTFPAIAPLIMLNIGGSIAASAGWQSLWWGGAVMAAVCAVLFAVVIQVPAPDPDEAVGPVEKTSVWAAFGNGRAWLLAIIQGSIAFVLFAFLTIYPQIFEGFYGLSAARAASLSSLSGLFGLVTCIASGAIIQKTGKPAIINLISCIGLVATCALTFALGSSTALYVAHIFVCSLCTGLVIPAVLAAAPTVAKSPVQIGATIALVNFVYYIGVAIGAPVISSAAAGGAHWKGALLPLVGVAVLSLVACVVYQLSSARQKAEVPAAEAV
ncbi:MAG: MFS transporter [Actinomycetes bacterium]|jgi:predicted MFS family arabinose efflux permease|nr:MFS transporter [Actinomycetes bacterium]